MVAAPEAGISAEMAGTIRDGVDGHIHTLLLLDCSFVENHKRYREKRYPLSALTAFEPPHTSSGLRNRSWAAVQNPVALFGGADDTGTF